MLSHPFFKLAPGLSWAVLAVTLQIPLGLWLGRDSYQLFLGAVAVSAVRAGAQNGAVTLVASLICKCLLFVLPWYPGYGQSGLFADRMLTFALIGAGTCWVCGALYDSEQRQAELVASARLLSGLLPICASCKRIRDDRGRWCDIESYIRTHSEAEFSHGFCPGCAARMYEDEALAGPPR